MQELGVQEEEAGQNSAYAVDPDIAGADREANGQAARIRLLAPTDALACADIEQVLFPEDSPWSAEAFASEIAAPHTHCLGLEVTDPANAPQLVGYAILAVGGPAQDPEAVSYTHLTLPTTARRCRSRWSPYH